MDSAISSNFHRPKEARFTAVGDGDGDFGYIAIEGNPITVYVMLTDTTSGNLHFLYQLREAVEKAFKYELEK